MKGNSRAVTSRQTGVHEDLARTVRRHLNSPFLRPISPVALEAFASLREQLDERPLILDSGCGVGDSTRRLALRFPDARVVGIDKSSDRLGRQREAPLPENALLLRADLVDFWRLAVMHELHVSRHYLLYPNPWPKIGHLQRRWHGHAVFPSLLQLGGIIELRTNWRTYAEEFAYAMAVFDAAQGDQEFAIEAVAARVPVFRELSALEIVPADVALTAPLTPFEHKYALSGQTLYRVLVDRRDVQAEFEGECVGISPDRI